MKNMALDGNEHSLAIVSFHSYVKYLLCVPGADDPLTRELEGLCSELLFQKGQEKKEGGHWGTAGERGKQKAVGYL